jgi:hypothetical protein
MSPRHARIAQLARAAVLMLGYAADDIERGLWTDVELTGLANALDPLAAALRGQDQTTVGRETLVIDAERIDR